MQFHLNGFQPGDPDIHDVAQRYAVGPRADAPPAEVDVLIVGSGPTGLTLAAQLAAFPDIKTAIFEQKAGPMKLGQADGVSCRSMEMFEAFGFADKVLREACFINETTFWRPDAQKPDHIHRADRVQDVEDGLSEFPHVILNQGRVHDRYLEVMRHAPTPNSPFYARVFKTLVVGDDGVTVTFERVDPGYEGRTETVKAKYVVGGDGARSGVRKALGFELVGDSANQAWGVMDILAQTDFPDVRFKCTVKSTEGSSLIIPREGGYLFRVYIELDKLGENERVAARGITSDYLIDRLNRIYRPYKFDVKEVAWWSVYEIGQRIADHFDDSAGELGQTPRVFIAGDACHTHSPKAGQGMNTSMGDTFNLGWKLAHVLRGQAKPELLKTYSAERRGVAQALIDFDYKLSRLISAPLKDPARPEAGGVDAEEFQRYFIRQLRFTAGLETQYQPALLTGEGRHQALAAGFPVGKRFHSAPVIRVSDAMRVELGHVVKADGRWRLFAFADEAAAASPSSRLAALAEFLGRASDSPVLKFTPKGADIDSVFDFRAIYQQGHRTFTIRDAPALLFPVKGRLGLNDYEKVFTPDLKTGPDIFDAREIDRRQGALVVVRPDQYVADVLPLDAYGALAAYFERFMVPRD
jgi:phenol 2-monooxygenase